MKTMYLVMDLINDLVHPDGANGSGLPAEVTRLDVLKNSATAIAKGRNEGVPIGYVIVGWSQDYREWTINGLSRMATITTSQNLTFAES